MLFKRQVMYSALSLVLYVSRRGNHDDNIRGDTTVAEVYHRALHAHMFKTLVTHSERSISCVIRIIKTKQKRTEDDFTAAEGKLR